MKKKGRPTLEEAAEIADRVLTSARAIFCRQGITGASMDEVAAASGVTKHTIYRRYASKLALVDAVIRRDFDQLIDTIEKVRRDAGPVAALRETAVRYFDFSVEPANAAFSGFLWGEAAFSDEMRDNLARWHEAYFEPMVCLIKAAQASGEMAPGRAGDRSRLLADLIGGAALHVRMGSPDPFGDRSPSEYFEERWHIFAQASAIVETPPPAPDRPTET